MGDPNDVFQGQTAGDCFVLAVVFRSDLSLAALSSNSRCSESVGCFSVRGISPPIQAGRGLDCPGYE